MVHRKWQLNPVLFKLRMKLFLRIFHYSALILVLFIFTLYCHNSICQQIFFLLLIGSLFISLSLHNCLNLSLILLLFYFPVFQCLKKRRKFSNKKILLYFYILFFLKIANTNFSKLISSTSKQKLNRDRKVIC